MLLGEFVNSLAKMAGVPEDNEHLVKLLAVKEVATAEIAGDLSTAIQSSLMTKDSAINNKEIVDTIWAKALNAVDGKLEEISKGVFDFDDTFIDTMKSGKGTYARMDLFANKIKETHQAAIKILEDAKGGTDDTGKAELQTKIDELNGELATIKDTTVSLNEHNEMVKNSESKMLDLHKKNLFSNYNYALDVSKDVNVLTASSLFDSELNRLGVTIVNDNGNLVLKTKLDNGDYTKYFKDNKEITPKDLADEILAQHKLLKVNGVPPAPPTPPIPPVPPAPGSGADADAIRIATEHVQSLQTLGEETPA